MNGKYGQSISLIAHSYPFLSPYVYGACNPVVLVDVDGRDIWIIDERGYILSRQKDKSKDKFYVVSMQNGKYELDENRSITFDKIIVKKVIRKKLKEEYGKKNYKLTIFKVKGGEEGDKLFQFLSDEITGNSGVEYGMFKERDKRTWVFTSHMKHKVKWRYVYDRFVDIHHLTECSHSHEDSNLISESDEKTKRKIIKNQERLNAPIPEFYIYNVKERNKIQY